MPLKPSHSQKCEALMIIRVTILSQPYRWGYANAKACKLVIDVIQLVQRQAEEKVG